MTDCDVKYRDWLQEWLVRIRGGVKESTWANYSVAVMNHILPALGEYTLEELTEEKLQETVFFWLRQGRREWRPVWKDGERSGQRCKRQPARSAPVLSPSPAGYFPALPRHGTAAHGCSDGIRAEASGVRSAQRGELPERRHLD